MLGHRCVSSQKGIMNRSYGSNWVVLALVLTSLTGISAAQTSEKLLVTSFQNGIVTEFQPGSSAPLAKVIAGTSPGNISVSPNGRIAYVGNTNQAYLSVIDLTLNREIARVHNVRTRSNVLNADGTRLVIPNFDATVTIVDTSNLQILKTIDLSGPLAGNGDMISSTVVGNQAYVMSRSSQVPPLAIDLTSYAVTPVTGVTGTGSAQPGLAATPDGRYVLAARNNTVQFIDTASNSVVQTLTLAGNVRTLTASRNNDASGVYGYTVSRKQGRWVIDAIDLNNGSATFGQLVSGAETVMPPNTPQAISLSSDDSTIYVTQVSPAQVEAYDANLLRTSPSTSHLASYAPGNVIDTYRATSAPIATAVPATAPQISGLSKTSLDNSSARKLTIDGANFTPTSLVKIGHSDPLPVEFISSSRIRVQLPAHFMAENAEILVTNPNSSAPVNQQYQSGMYSGKLQVTSPNFAVSQPAVIGESAQGGVFETSFNSNSSYIPLPGGLFEVIQVSPKGDTAYVGGFSNLYAANLNTAAVQTLDTNEGAIFGFATAPLAANPVTGAIGDAMNYAVLTHCGDISCNDTLEAFDADTASSAYNTQVETVASNFTNADTPAAVVASPDGAFVYSYDIDSQSLLIFDTNAQSVSSVDGASLGISPTGGAAMAISQDGNSLYFSDQATTVSILNLQNRTNPTPQAALALGIEPDLIAVQGSRLFVLELSTATLKIVDLSTAGNPVLATYPSLFTPGARASLDLAAVQMSVSQDGSQLFLPMADQSSVAVYDVSQILKNKPDPLITQEYAGSHPAVVTLVPAATSLNLASSTSKAAAGSSVTLTATVSAPSLAGGLVSFYDGNTYLGSATAGTTGASWTTAPLASGTHSFSANYAGNWAFGPSSGSTTVTVK